MEKYTILKIQQNAALIDKAATWFSQKWNISKQAYIESMKQCIKNTIPQWYILMEQNTILAGMGVIENDFHNRKDLTPNVCAVYVEKAYRCQGIAGKMLQYVCQDMKQKNIDTLYLVTDHTSFYERYGWKFFCMVQCEGETNLSRIYVKKL